MAIFGLIHFVAIEASFGSMVNMFPIGINAMSGLYMSPTTNLKSDMASAFDVLDKDSTKKRGTGVIICRSEYKLKLRENLYALPIEYI